MNIIRNGQKIMLNEKEAEEWENRWAAHRREAQEEQRKETARRQRREQAKAKVMQALAIESQDWTLLFEEN